MWKENQKFLEQNIHDAFIMVLQKVQLSYNRFPEIHMSFSLLIVLVLLNGNAVYTFLFIKTAVKL